MNEWIEKKVPNTSLLEGGGGDNAADSPSTTLSSSIISDSDDYESTTSSSTSLQNIPIQEAGLWKYSKTRQFTFW